MQFICKLKIEYCSLREYLFFEVIIDLSTVRSSDTNMILLRMNCRVCFRVSEDRAAVI